MMCAHSTANEIKRFSQAVSFIVVLIILGDGGRNIKSIAHCTPVLIRSNNIKHHVRRRHNHMDGRKIIYIYIYI